MRHFPLPEKWLGASIYAFCLLTWALFPGLWQDLALPAGLLLLACAFALFLAKNRRYFSLPDFLFFYALIYLWIAPAMAYAFAGRLHSDANFMPIAAEQYFALAIPGVLALLLGANLALALLQKEEGEALKRFEEQLSAQPWLPFVLIALGLAGKALFPYAPPGLRAVAYFVFWLCFTGSFYLLFLRTKWKWAVLGLVFLVFLRWSLSSTQAGPPLWVLVFAAVLFFYRRKTVAWKQALFYAGAMALVLAALQIKFDFREAMRKNGMPKELPGQIALFSRSLLQGDTAFLSPQRWTRTLDRFNQGYHVAMAMKHTPAAEPFARGETIAKAALGALAPRVLWPGKPVAGGHEMYRRFAGQNINYSANLGPLGETYVNFGRNGAVIAMLLYGFLLGAWFAGLSRLAVRRWPALLLWLPFIFSAMLSVETDFATVLNHGVKATLFCGGAWGIERVIKLLSY